MDEEKFGETTCSIVVGLRHRLAFPSKCSDGNNEQIGMCNSMVVRSFAFFSSFVSSLPSPCLFAVSCFLLSWLSLSPCSPFPSACPPSAHDESNPTDTSATVYFARCICLFSLCLRRRVELRQAGPGRTGHSCAGSVSQ